MKILQECETTQVYGGVNVTQAGKLGAQIGAVIGVLIPIALSGSFNGLEALVLVPLMSFGGFYIGAFSVGAMFAGSAIMINTTYEWANA